MRSGNSSSGRLAQASIAETWDRIKQGMDACFFEKSMKRAPWMELQTQVYNLAVDMSTTEPPGAQYLRPSVSRSRNKETTPVNKRCAEVYQKVKSYFESYLHNLSEECKQHPEEDLLVFYKQKWHSYVKAASTVDGLFEYVNRTYVQRQRDQNSSIGSFSINDLALVSWRDTLYFSLKRRITDALFQLITRERNGEQINTQLVSHVLQSLVRLSIPNPWDSSRTLPAQVGNPNSLNTFQTAQSAAQSSVVASNSSASGAGGGGGSKRDSSSIQTTIFFYKENFEDEFIFETEEFYRNESAQFIREHSFTEYMSKAEGRLEEEKFRVSLYLHTDTERRLVHACEKVLIEDHIDRYYQEYVALLRDHKTEDLARVFKLCSRVKNTLERLQEMFQEHVTAKGIEAMDRVLESSDRSKSHPGKSELPKLYAEAILSVHKLFSDLISQAFDNSAGFLTALDLANEQYINRNPVILQPLPNQPALKPGETVSNPAKSSAELLALYFDSLLRFSARKADDNDLEEHLQDSMIIFKYITEKDVFSRFFHKHLANRLVSGSSVSDDAEQSMLEKLKSTCGFEYTTKFQKMYTDVNLSKKLSEEFRKPPARLDFDFSIIIGTSSSWPFSSVKGYILPKEFQSTYDKFKMFYNQKHSNRKLEWQWSRCKGEVAATCFHKTYVFIASLYQMGVLLLFNRNSTLSIAHIVQECGIPSRESAIQVVQQLVKFKILSSSGDETDENTEISVSNNYQNKKVKVPIAMPVKAEQRHDRAHTDRQVEEDRKNVIQAAIVRIMKMRKRLSHNSLIQEAIDQVRSRFQPTIASIKKEIDTLIEKDFLRRADDQRNMYEYVA